MGKFFIVLGIIVVAIILAWRFGAFGGIIKGSEEAECKKIGGQWGTCFNSGPCCSLGGFTDANKQCTSSSQCQSRVCEISKDNQPDRNGLYSGLCVPSYAGTPKDFFKPQCGQASIEQGKIIKDYRSQNCVVY
jgi:hypothetical protein